MGWIYFQESVELGSDFTNTLEQSLIVSMTDMHKAFYCRECNQVKLIERRYGTTSQRCELNTCQKLTSYSEGFPVKTSVSLDVVKAWQESEADFSSKLSDSQMKFDRLLSSLKMSQPLGLEDWSKLSKHLPKSGMTVGGRCLLPQALEPPTNANDGSSWPTPCARDWKDSPGQKDRGGRDDSKLAMRVFRENNSGQLSPMWVEWLMGYRIGWTELNALVIPLFRYKSKRRSKNLLENNKRGEA